MPSRRSDTGSSDADAQMRKLDASLASLRSAAREYARQRQEGGSQLEVLQVTGTWRRVRPDESESPNVAPQEARFALLNRVVTRLRLIGRKLLSTRWR
jgi:hypothetical protein